MSPAIRTGDDYVYREDMPRDLTMELSGVYDIEAAL